MLYKVNKEYYTSHLVNRLAEAGILTAITPGSKRQVVHYWIKSGKITPRRRPHSNWYIFNEDEINQIIKEFSAGGSGKWSASA